MVLKPTPIQSRENEREGRERGREKEGNTENNYKRIRNLK